MDGRTIIIHSAEPLAGGAASPAFALLRALRDARYQVVLLSRSPSRGESERVRTLEQRLRGADVDAERSWLITDDPAELPAARGSGCRTILIDACGRWCDGPEQPRYVVGNLPQAARLILSLDGRVRAAAPEGPVLGSATTR